VAKAVIAARNRAGPHANGTGTEDRNDSAGRHQNGGRADTAVDAKASTLGTGDRFKAHDSV
jgi:hypothetical protein